VESTLTYFWNRQLLALPNIGRCARLSLTVFELKMCKNYTKHNVPVPIYRLILKRKLNFPTAGPVTLSVVCCRICVLRLKHSVVILLSHFPTCFPYPK